MLLTFFERLLGSDEKPDPKSPTNISHGVDRIQHLLTSYQAYNQLLSVTILAPNQKKLATASTEITKINSENNSFATAYLYPELNEQILEPGVAAQFSLSYQGTRHQFKCNWMYDDKQPESGIAHWFQFPKGIERLQLRNAFRVPISQAHPVRVSVTRKDHSVLVGNLFDLSATGMRLGIAGDLKLKTREDYHACHFVIPDGSTIICRGQLIHWHYDQTANQTYIGIQFRKINGLAQRTLNRFLTDVQRKHRQIDQ